MFSNNCKDRESISQFKLKMNYSICHHFLSRSWVIHTAELVSNTLHAPIHESGGVQQQQQKSHRHLSIVVSVLKAWAHGRMMYLQKLGDRTTSSLRPLPKSLKTTVLKWRSSLYLNLCPCFGVLS